MRLTLRLPDALHARPANLLVRVALAKRSDIVIRKGACSGNAKNILDVLSIGAAKGDEVSIDLVGDDAQAAADAIRELIERNFDSDLVPETGTAGVPGVAIGRAVIVESRESWADAAPGTPTRERERLDVAFAGVRRDVQELVDALRSKTAGRLESTEATLFEPEIAILEALVPRALERVVAGMSAENAVRRATEGPTTDLLLDARTRLLDALAGASTPELAAEVDAIVVTEVLTPSLVAGLPPNVVGIVAGAPADTPRGFTSHAAILARGREIPLAFVPNHVTAAISTGDLVVVDTTEDAARVWVAPSEARVDAARARQRALAHAREEEERRALAPLSHLRVAVRVNVGALGDTIPAAAEGVGLLRTELLFAGRAHAPSELEQIASLIAIARRSGNGPVVARLFDAGGDKPVAWLAPPRGAPDIRGIGLLLCHEQVLGAQLRALVRAGETADVRILLPLVNAASEVRDVRARLERPLLVGAMVETPAAVDLIESIADAADFICIGTNDLAAFVLGVARADATLSFDGRVVTLARRIVQGAHAQGKGVTVCGEMAGDVRGAQILVGLGVDSLSVAPARVAPIRNLLARSTREECERAAHEAESVQ